MNTGKKGFHCYPTHKVRGGFHGFSAIFFFVFSPHKARFFLYVQQKSMYRKGNMWTRKMTENTVRHAVRKNTSFNIATSRVSIFHTHTNKKKKDLQDKICMCT